MATAPTAAAQQSPVLRHQSAAVIQRCYRWLDRVIPTAPALSGLAASLTTAVQLYGAQQYVASLNQTASVIAAVNQARAVSPQLPPL